MLHEGDGLETTLGTAPPLDPATPPVTRTELAPLPGGPAGPTVRTSADGDLSISTSVPVYPSQEVLGLTLSACSMSELVGTVEAWVDEGVPRSATYVNANVVNISARDPRVRSLIRAHDVQYVDGQSMVWAGRLLGLPVPERVATTDLIHPLAAMCARRDFGLFLLGGKDEVVRRAAERLMVENPGLRVQVHDGYFGEADDGSVVEAVNRSGAQILLIGMGDPRQQVWLRDHLGVVNPTVLLSCGGLFDWLGGSFRRPPQWMVRAGLEWLWRIYLEPRRLGPRYLVGNPEFLARLLVAAVRRRLRRRPAADPQD